MARVSAHGTEVGTVFFTTSAKRYMSDGVILKNNGFGWKLAGKVKDGTPQEAFQRRLEAQNALLSELPATRAYRKLLHSMAGLSKRWKLHMAVELMPDDADGVWSEACDGYGENISADVDECGELCRAYKIAVEESKARKARKLETA